MRTRGLPRDSLVHYVCCVFPHPAESQKPGANSLGSGPGSRALPQNNREDAALFCSVGHFLGCEYSHHS